MIKIYLKQQSHLIRVLKIKTEKQIIATLKTKHYD